MRRNDDRKSDPARLTGSGTTVVRRAYDSQASWYDAETRLQSGNLGKLLDAVEANRVAIHDCCLLDIGSGTGILVHELAKRGAQPRPYVGLDISPRMLAVARGHMSTANLVAGDVTRVPVADAVADVVVANSVLHWTNAPELGMTTESALHEIHRVLKPGGTLAASISGVGTAARFLNSYRTVLQNDDVSEVVERGRLRRDPIGSMSLDQVVSLLGRTRFDIGAARMDYEPVMYDTPACFAATAKAYGWGMFLAPVAPPARADVWRRVVAQFDTDVGPGPYRHDQYMIYIVAQRRT